MSFATQNPAVTLVLLQVSLRSITDGRTDEQWRITVRGRDEPWPSLCNTQYLGICQTGDIPWQHVWSAERFLYSLQKGICNCYHLLQVLKLGTAGSEAFLSSISSLPMAQYYWGSIPTLCIQVWVRRRHISPAARSHELQQLPSKESPSTTPCSTAPRHPSTSGSGSRLCGDSADIPFTLLNSKQSAHHLLQVLGHTAPGPLHTSHGGGTHHPQPHETLRHNIPLPKPCLGCHHWCAKGTFFAGAGDSGPVPHQHWCCTVPHFGGEFLPFPSTHTNYQKLCLLYSHLPGG